MFRITGVGASRWCGSTNWFMDRDRSLHVVLVVSQEGKDEIDKKSVANIIEGFILTSRDGR